MIDVNKLNRIKGILSARLGAEIPKHLAGAKFAKQKDSTIIYSSDGNTWFSDPNLTLLYLGDTSQFQDISTQNVRTTEIPGGNPNEGNPNAMVESNAETLKKGLDVSTQLKAKELAIPEMVKIDTKSINNTELLTLPNKIKSLSLEELDSLFEKDNKSGIFNLLKSNAFSALTTVGDALGASQQATDSNLTKGITAGYRAVLDLASNFGPVGAAVSQAMGIASAVGNIAQSLGGGTDLMTTTDQILDSPLGTITGVGLINGFGGKKTMDFQVDTETIDEVGSSYGGTVDTINEAKSKANKKYGLFSSSARKKANAFIQRAARLLNAMTDIANTRLDLLDMSSSLGLLAGLQLYNNLNGNAQYRYLRAAKLGAKLNLIEEILPKQLEWEPLVELNWELPEFKEGGNIDINEELEWIPELQKEERYPKEYLKFKASLPDNQKNTPESDYDTYLGWKLYGKPKDFETAKELGMYTWDNSDNSWHGNTIAWDETTGIGYFLKPKHHSTIGYELDWFNKGLVTEEGGKQREMTPEERKEWEDFKNNYTLIDEGDFYKYIPKNKKGDKYKDVYDFYKDYDLSNIHIIEGDLAKTEGNNIYITNDEDLVHELWHYLSQNNPNETYKEFYDNLNDLRIQELGGNLQFISRLGDPGIFYHPSELEARIKAAKYKAKGLKYTKDFFKELRNNPEKYGYNMRDLLYMYNDENLEKIFSLKLGGTISSSDVPEIEETNLKNVIPEGALHKNKHHMEHAEGLTKKGIPVIDEDGELLAEIEHSEIIFTLEVTKKLEEYYDIFYSEESSNKEKEQAALDAGKLLVYQILENTEDRTGLIESCKKGGSITLKKSTDDLIEEALDWMPTLMVVEDVIEEVKLEEKPKKKSEKELMKEAIKEALIELLIK